MSSTINPHAVPCAQGQDAERLRSTVDRVATEVKDYTVQYEEHRTIVEALGTAQLAPENKSALDILALRERWLDATRILESIAIRNLTNYCIADNNVLQAQATSASTAIAPSADSATTSNFPASPSEKKNMKRKLPEPRDGWKGSSGKLHRAHSDAITYHKTMLTLFLWLIVDVLHR